MAIVSGIFVPKIIKIW